MARAIKIDNLAEYSGLSEQDVELAIRENINYATDIHEAINLAMRCGLASCTISVARTPTPGSDDEVVDISVRGLMRATNFNEAIRNIIKAGPDETTYVWEVDNGQHS